MKCFILHSSFPTFPIPLLPVIPGCFHLNRWDWCCAICIYVLFCYNAQEFFFFFSPKHSSGTRASFHVEPATSACIESWNALFWNEHSEIGRRKKKELCINGINISQYWNRKSFSHLPFRVKREPLRRKILNVNPFVHDVVMAVIFSSKAKSNLTI